MSTNLTHVARIVIQARKNLGMSRRELSAVTGIARSTMARIEHAETTPHTETLDRLEVFFGWRRGLLTEVIESDHPEQVTDEAGLTGQPAETELTDEALLWELTHRLQSKDDLIAQLQARVRHLEAENKRLREP